MKKSFLITGLESCCTRYVSILIALNLGLIKNQKNWDGHETIENENFLIEHKSLPHGARDNFIKKNYWQNYDVIIIPTRDWNCSLISKSKSHQKNKILAEKEHKQGQYILKQIVESDKTVAIFSYESAFILGESYTKKFLKSIDVPFVSNLNLLDINKKYLKQK